MNAPINYSIKTIINEMVHADIVDISDDSTKLCVSWILCQVSEYHLNMFVNSWTHYTIPSMLLFVDNEMLIKRKRIENNIVLTKILV